MSEPALKTGIVLILVASVIAVLATLSLHSVLTDDNEEQGGIEWDAVQMNVEADRLILQATARVQLPDTVRVGLDSGVPLTFVLRFDVQQSRLHWFSQPVFSAQRRFTLTYYELTRHYRVSTLEQSQSRNYRSLSAALNGLGEIGRLDFELDVQQQRALKARKNSEFIASVDMHLSTSTLPLPLQPFFNSSWTLVSEEYRWPVT